MFQVKNKPNITKVNIKLQESAEETALSVCIWIDSNLYKVIHSVFASIVSLISKLCNATHKSIIL
jgi:hypothetical protein